MSDLQSEGDQSEQGGPDSPAAAAVRPAFPRRPGRPKGLGKVPGSGRVKGKQPRAIGELRAEILLKGRPLEFLYKVVSGAGVRVGPQGGPGEAVVAYPTLSERIKAALILLNKCMPDLQMEAIQVSGDLVNAPPAPRSDLETARTIAFLLASAARGRSPKSETADVAKSG